MIGMDNMLSPKITSLLIAGAIAMSISGCGTESVVDAGDTKAVGEHQHGATPADKSASNTGTEPAGNRTVKTGAALQFTHDMPSAPLRANGSYNVKVNVAHNYSGQTLILEATADSGLNIASKSTSIQLIPGSTASWNIPFTTGTDGLYYIDMVGTVIDANGSKQARAYSVRVEVGDQSAQKKQSVDEVILPAEEEILR